MFYAHSKEDKPETEWQTLKEHSENVAQMVGDFSRAWCTEEFAKNLGLLHDIGKYQEDFQKRLHHANIRVEHSICGAKEALHYGMTNLAAYCIAGHHSGLPDIGTKYSENDSSLQSRLKHIPQDFFAYKRELTPSQIEGMPMKGCVRNSPTQKEWAFWTRMMFSCLTDADFLDTEAFCNGTTERGIYVDFEDCLQKLNAVMNSFANDTPVKKARQELLFQALSHYNESADIWLMNMPTGSGKTLASMRFALERAVKTGKKHIIYVIPYTSIIEQNAKVFKHIFGEEGVLEHHCNYDFEIDENLTLAEKMKKSAENWDASIIVTTNVQFFESIYSNRTSKLRKLHNMANSILVFDEMHMLPMNFYQPCLEAIQMLVTQYQCEAMFLTATMPDFRKWLKEFGCEGSKIVDLIQDKTCFSAFKRCRIDHLGKISDVQLIEKAENQTPALIVVNSRAKAREIYEKLSGEKYHLSTYMTVKDRTRIIAAIRKALAQNRPVAVVSTSLIEAGVDLDFATVFRETAGLDNLLQTAGRCNREGKREGAVAYSFTLETDRPNRKGELTTKEHFTDGILNKYQEVDCQESICEYFDRLYEYRRNEMTQMDFANYVYRGDSFDFRRYAEDFKVIDDNSRNVLILYPDDAEQQALLQKLEYGGKSVYRRLQKYMVSLKKHEYDKLCQEGVLSQIGNVECLANENYYDREIGIRFEDDSTYIY